MADRSCQWIWPGCDAFWPLYRAGLFVVSIIMMVYFSGGTGSDVTTLQT
jgi:hypothetical protein